MDQSRFRQRINDYEDSVFAILGFIHIFRFDNNRKELDENVSACQGRKLRTSEKNKISPSVDVTPDICIKNFSNNGIIGEVKKSFPRDKELWLKDFKQLMKYDDNFINWISDSEGISHHEIVLLPEQNRSRAVKEYYLAHKGKDFGFEKNFIIVEFNRNDSVNAYFFFRKEYGEFTYFGSLNEKLNEGIGIRIENLLKYYEKVKLYDSKPPLPWLLYLIWDIVLLKASEDDNFYRRKVSKIETSIDSILADLKANYSFKSINGDDSSQQEIPRRAWISEAFNSLVLFGMATWKDKSKGECIISFKKMRTTLDDFINLCIKFKLDGDYEEIQPSLFPEMVKSNTDKGES